MLVLEAGGKQENMEKNPRSKGEIQQQTESTYDAGSWNRTQDILVIDERSHHCTTPTPLKYFSPQYFLIGNLSSITRTSLPLTRSNFRFPSVDVLDNFILDNLNHVCQYVTGQNVTGQNSEL